MARCGWSQTKFAVVAFAVCLFPFVSTTFRLYQVDRILDSSRQRRHLLLSLFVTFSLMAMIGAAAKSVEAYSRLWFFSWFMICAGAMILSRAIIIDRLRVALRHRAYVFKAISLGSPARRSRRRDIAQRSNHEVFVVSEQRRESLAELANLSEMIADAGDRPRLYHSAMGGDSRRLARTRSASAPLDGSARSPGRSIDRRYLACVRFSAIVSPSRRLNGPFMDGISGSSAPRI